MKNLNNIEKFNEKQKYIMNMGLKENLDISAYAKPEFSWKQMYEIYEGIRNRIDVSAYTNPEYSPEKMNNIRKELEKSYIDYLLS